MSMEWHRFRVMSIDRVKNSLKAEGIDFVELGGVKPNPRSGLVYEGISLCKKENVDFIVAVGGGSTIDSSKAIAAGGSQSMGLQYGF